MNLGKINNVQILANDVLDLCEDVEKMEREASLDNDTILFYGNAKTGELKRRSMDLSKALTELRQPG